MQSAAFFTLGSELPFAAVESATYCRTSAFAYGRPILCNCGERLVSAHCVEKIRISDVVIFRKETVMPQIQMKFVTRRNELPHERQQANWAEPLASEG